MTLRKQCRLILFGNGTGKEAERAENGEDK